MKARRFMSLLLALMMLAATACSNDSGDGGKDTSGDVGSSSGDTAEATRYTELGERDFNKEKFTVLDANTSYDIHINMPGEEVSGETVSAELYKRDLFIEEKYNVNIEWDQIRNAQDGCDVIRQCVMTNDDTYDMIISILPNNTLGTLATEGLLYNLNSSEYLSLDKPWWSSLMAESLKVDDKVFYTTGDISPSIYQMAACVYVNPSLCQQYGIEEDFYQLVRDNEWTYDKILELTNGLDRDVNNDNKMHAMDDFFGLAAFKVGISDIRRMMVAADINFTELNDEGHLVANYVNERTLEVVNIIKQIFDVNMQYEDHNDMINHTFGEDRAMMFFGVTEYAYVHLRDMESDYIIMPMPKYEITQESYRHLTNPFVNCYVAIPKTVDTDRAGFLAEAMAYYSYTNIRPVAYEENFKQKAARDEESFEMLDLIFDNLYIDFGAFLDFGGQQWMLQEIVRGNNEFMSGMTSIADAMQAEITALEEAWMDIEG